MQPLLFDQGVYPQVAHALHTLEVDAYAVGDPGAPIQGSSDETNIKWCKERGAVLVTNDRGKKDKTILDLLTSYRVHALFVHNDLRADDPHKLAYALLRAEGKIDHWVGGKHLLRHRLRPNGGIEKR